MPPPPTLQSPTKNEQEAKATVRLPPPKPNSPTTPEQSHQLPLPSKYDKRMKELEEENRRFLREGQRPLVPEVQRTVVAQGSGGAGQKDDEAPKKSQFEEFNEELKDLEDRFGRRT